jgi:predicted metal-dependent HD superfamily phosphohydrolase
VRHLPEAWLRDAGAVGARGDVAAAGAQILARYAEPHRRYHGLAHLDSVLRTVDDLGTHATRLPVVRMAAWFHDAVYGPTAQDNEERSARLAETVLAGLRVDDATVSDVGRLVRVTTDHDPDPADADAAVLCDADLAVLASGTTAYQDYVSGVRAEYAHLDDATFVQGRAAVLRRLLAQEPLFRTPAGRSAWEATARENLRAELAGLGGVSGEPG